jgi:hypothetical protein
MGAKPTGRHPPDATVPTQVVACGKALPFSVVDRKNCRSTRPPVQPTLLVAAHEVIESPCTHRQQIALAP